MTRFAESASRLAGMTGLLLGWRPGEFWASTPAEVAAVLGGVDEAGDPFGAADLERLRELFPD